LDSSDTSIAICILGALFILVGSITSCTVIQNGQDDNTMLKMVQNGSDPISARCAVKTTGAECAVIAARH
jgi:hypothetical protein